jgi:hypothetical protein
VCGNPLETSRSIMEVPRVFLNPKPNPNSSYKKSYHGGGEGFTFSLVVDYSIV